MDSFLLEALYGSETHRLFNLAEFQNTSDILMMGTLFIILPMVWLGD
ncbi:hypothetical protein [Xenorhabdus sp. IM139775]|nr:hypothetical protein [Xenorhabdus sp. IM139775]MDC9594713.1 hypothetical protein [Xenorhabdus sp. IM139775]